MIRLLFRFLGIVLLAAAFAALIIDGTKSIAATSVIYTPTSETARALFPQKFPLLQPFMEHSLHPALWSPVMTNLLRLPIWVVIAIFGMICLLLGRKKRPKIGYYGR